MAYAKNRSAAAASTEDRGDIYQRVTDQIVAAIEAGSAGKWVMPWNASDTSGAWSNPINVVSRKAYRGVNVLALWAAAQAKGYTAQVWATYKQWGELGAQVRKGEKATTIVFWQISDRPAASGEGEGEGSEGGRRSVMARAYSVFNAAQVEGYEAPAAPEPRPAAERDAAADAFFGSLGMTVAHGGNRAFYAPSVDRVQMPAFEAFISPEAYYGTLAHEAVHWTSHADRCNRVLGKRFGDEAYAAEELVAELGAAFLCASLGVTPEPRPDHAAYVQSWLKVLKADKRAIFSAAALAQKAADWMHNTAAEAGAGDAAEDDGEGEAIAA